MQAAAPVLYVDHGSQPCRALLLFCRLNNIPHTEKLVLIHKGATRTPEYAAINPNRKVPAMDDNGFRLFESHTIMRYLAQKYRVADHWYPADLKERCRVDAMLDWHHTNVRRGAGGLVFQFVVRKLLTGKEATPELVQDAQAALNIALSVMEKILSTQKYLARDEVSLSDLSTACELTQLRMLPEGMEPHLEKYPRVREWFARVAALPHFADVHVVVDKIAAASRRPAKL